VFQDGCLTKRWPLAFTMTLVILDRQASDRQRGLWLFNCDAIGLLGPQQFPLGEESSSALLKELVCEHAQSNDSYGLILGKRMTERK